MPLYEYQCQTCGVRFERLERKSDPTLKQCPECTGPVRRLIQSPGIIFKGSGFYVTDNRRFSTGSRRSDSKKKKTSTEKSDDQ
ncbi:MAG: zinc ribbon domain-containing protein [Chloroflexi bacterium]|nr:zinc ribbon domain-containing protein [Chloroflexota bacterium]